MLNVPWMGVVTMAMARYPHFFEALWCGVRPLAESNAFSRGCLELRETTEREVRRLAPEPIEGMLKSIGYAELELERILDSPYFQVGSAAVMQASQKPTSSTLAACPQQTHWTESSCMRNADTADSCGVASSGIW